MSSRGPVVSASPMQLHAAPRLASSEGAGESNSRWCSQRFTDPLRAPGGASSVINLTLGIMGASFSGNVLHSRAQDPGSSLRHLPKPQGRISGKAMISSVPAKQPPWARKRLTLEGQQHRTLPPRALGQEPALLYRLWMSSGMAVRPRSCWAKTKEPLHM